MKKVAIIYDLDNTIFPTKEISKRIADYIIHAIISNQDGQCADFEIEKIKEDLYQSGLVDVAKKYAFPDRMILAGKQALESVPFEEQLFPYDDCHLIEHLPLRSFLVTSGNKIFQENKIKNLAITHLFEEIYIDDENSPVRVGKEIIFEEILSNLKCRPEQVIVVGDMISSEIMAGNNLGMHTVQILRPGVQKGIEAMQQISSFNELFAIEGIEISKRTHAYS